MQNKNLKILIQGWATDYRIFEKIIKKNEKYDTFYYKNFSANKKYFDKFVEDLKFLAQKYETMEIIGWSLGAFVAIDILKKLEAEEPKIFENITKNLILQLWSISEYYDKNNIENIKKYLKKNKNLYLKKFYEKCFFNAKNNEKYIKFEKKYQNSYFEIFSNLENLLNGLNYLKNSKFDENFVINLANRGTKIIIKNCIDDKISKKLSANILRLDKKSENIKIEILEKCGHLFFFE